MAVTESFKSNHASVRKEQSPTTPATEVVGWAPSKIVDVEEWRKYLQGSSPKYQVIGIDFETYYNSDYSVKKLGNFAYCQNPEFKAFLVAVTDGVFTCVDVPENFPWETISGLEWVSHNREFDCSVWKRLKELNIINPEIKGPGIWNCSAALSAYLQFPRNLAGAVKEVFGKDLDKSVRAHFKSITSDKIKSDFSDEEIIYSARDAEATLALWRHLENKWPVKERELFELTCQMGNFGLAVDWKYIGGEINRLTGTLANLKDALPWSPPGSIKQFKQACTCIGIHPPSSTAASDSSLLRWMRTNKDSQAVEWAQNMQHIRSGNRIFKILKSMLNRRKPDGRMAYELKYYGATTGRWAGGGGLNLQNLNRKATSGVDLRRAIIPKNGNRLAVVDYSQIESRVILYLAGDHKSLSMIRGNPDADVYEIHARTTMNYNSDETLKSYCNRTRSTLRQLAKARVLGLGFGCGWRKFIEVAQAMSGLELSEKESKRAVNEFRNSNPLIVDLWHRLEEACASCDGGDYILPLPATQFCPECNRYLFYRDVKTNSHGIECIVSGQKSKVYGGLLAENWTQATARDVLASAWLRCVDAGFHPILSVHDELVFELPETGAEEGLKRIIEIMESPLPWAPPLPLRVDGELMDHYSK